MRAPWTEERDRFSQVMASRKTAGALIELFDKLAESEKFAIPAKPYCFADLVAACAVRVPASSLDALLDAVAQTWAGDCLWRLYPESDAAQRLGPLVLKVVEASNKAGVLERRLHGMRCGGLIKSFPQACTIAHAAGLPPARLAALQAAVAVCQAQLSCGPECPF